MNKFLKIFNDIFTSISLIITLVFAGLVAIIIYLFLDKII